jgi:hypothetical protein
MINDMDENSCDIKEIITITTQSLNKTGFEYMLNFKDVQSLDELKKYLTEKITLMMEANFDLLVNSLYRIDIDEEKVKVLFSDKIRGNIPAGLASLIIERQLQKLYYRNKYKNENL